MLLPIELGEFGEDHLFLLRRASEPVPLHLDDLLRRPGHERLVRQLRLGAPLLGPDVLQFLLQARSLRPEIDHPGQRQGNGDAVRENRHRLWVRLRGAVIDRQLVIGDPGQESKLTAQRLERDARSPG